MADFLINDALTFLSVIDEGSFAGAAKKCSISSSVISKRIARLENQLRVQLLQRTTRSISLTEIGQIFYDRCKRIRAEISDTAEDVLKHHQKPSGLLRINAPMSFGQLYLLPAINEFMQQNPETQIELILGSQYANFIHHGLDLAIFIKDLPNTHLLRSRKIAVRHNGVYGSPYYFSQHPAPKILEDLQHHNCLLYQAEPGNTVGLGQKYDWVFYKQEKKFRVPVSGSFRVNSSQALLKSALAGIGLAKLSSFMVTEELKKGQLISVLNEYCAHDIEIHAVYPNQRYLPHKVKLFIDFLVERFNAETIGICNNK